MQSFFFFRKTFPIGSRRNGRSLVLMFSVLVFFLSFIVSCVFLFNQGFQKWGSPSVCKMTVEIPANFQNTPAPLYAQKIQNVAEVLKKTDGVLNVLPVSQDRLRSMLKMWAGETSLNENFPFPILFDIEIDPQKSVNIEQIRAQLREISADINIENHNSWAQRLLIFGRSLKTITLLLGGILSLCAVIIVILVTKSALQAYSSSLSILRLLGAKNSYISLVFQNQIIRAVLWGSLFGFSLVCPTLYAFMMMLKSLGLEGMAWTTLLKKELCIVCEVPFGVLIMSWLASRMTVFFYLRSIENQNYE
jgi:cell division protein FtsX